MEEWSESHPEGYRFECCELSDPEQLVRRRPDVVVQIVDSTDLDESLVITPQIIDMHLKLVLVLNKSPRQQILVKR